MSIMPFELVMPSKHLFLSPPLLFLPSIFPSIRVFYSESALHITWPKYRSFSVSFSISPFHEYSGLISFRTDWFDLLAVRVTHPTPKRLLCCEAAVTIRAQKRNDLDWVKVDLSLIEQNRWADR